MRLVRSVLATLLLAGLASSESCGVPPTPAPTGLVNASTPSPTPAATTPGAEHVQAKIRRGDVRSRSVNLGAWLVSEHWMSYESPLFAGVADHVASRGEYALMRELGYEKGAAACQAHREFWITEDEVAAIAAAGLNTVRVPVGFWIVCDDDSPAYEFGLRSGCVRDPASAAPGASQINTYARGSLRFLDRLVNDWAVKYNVAVMLSLHAHQGSQNGYEHSAPVEMGDLGWFRSAANRDNSVNFSAFLAKRYKSSPAFLGMNVLNEPRMDSGRSESEQWQLLRDYYERVYAEVRGDGNGCVLAVSPMLQQQDAVHLQGLLDDGSYTNVWHELHSYYIWGYPVDREADVLNAVDAYAAGTIIPASENANNRLYVGEWCMGGPPDERGIFKDMGNFHKLGEKQLEMLDTYPTGGWAFWSWRHSDDSIDKLTGWSLRALLRKGDLKLTL